MSERRVIRRAGSEQRIDRMAFWGGDNELLAASPLRSRVLRYDVDTLAFKRAFESVFGVRVLAIDALRGLLLSGSLVTGELLLSDLATGRPQLRLYLGPWLRSIEIAAERGVAYVSSNGFLYEVPYAESVHLPGTG